MLISGAGRAVAGTQIHVTTSRVCECSCHHTLSHLLVELFFLILTDLIVKK